MYDVYKLLVDIRESHFLNMSYDGSLCLNVKQLDLLNNFFFTITLLEERKRIRKEVMDGKERENENSLFSPYLG